MTLAASSPISPPAARVDHQSAARPLRSNTFRRHDAQRRRSALALLACASDLFGHEDITRRQREKAKMHLSAERRGMAVHISRISG